MGSLKAGMKAPDFTLGAGDGGTIRLSSFQGKKHVVLYFYPRDNTPGCTQEACDFRDSWKRVEKAGAVVLGISADSAASHLRFSGKFELPFPLLSDEEKKVIKAYGVWQKKTFMGKTFMGIVRSTFVIDKKGKIVRIFEKVKVKGHVDEVLGTLSELA